MATRDVQSRIIAWAFSILPMTSSTRLSLRRSARGAIRRW